MPIAAQHACNHIGCDQLIDRGKTYCDRHKQVGAGGAMYGQRVRISAARQGYNRKWQRYRLNYLARNPLCVECQKAGRLTPATEIDHIVSAKGQRDPLFWLEDNHRALCKSCHSRKTMLSRSVQKI